MKTVRNINLCCLLTLGLLMMLPGCGKKADENKPVSEVSAEAEKMSSEELRAMAQTYKEAVLAKSGEIKSTIGKLKDIAIADQLGSEAKELKAEISNLRNSASALKERFQIYYGKLKEKGRFIRSGDSGLRAPIVWNTKIVGGCWFYWFFRVAEHIVK